MILQQLNGLSSEFVNTNNACNNCQFRLLQFAFTNNQQLYIDAHKRNALSSTTYKLVHVLINSQSFEHTPSLYLSREQRHTTLASSYFLLIRQLSQKWRPRPQREWCTSSSTELHTQIAAATNSPLPPLPSLESRYPSWASSLP
jgi:hypothetical protein